MVQNKELHHISADLQQLNEAFHTIVHPYRSSLWNYCKHLTGSPWDAEDLLQETLLKAFASLTRIRQTLTPKTYLFRIASNTWLDHCRRNKIKIDDVDIEQTEEMASVSIEEINEAMETLIHHLPPRQASILLLMDVYLFTAKETAEMMGTTEGAVNAALNRARTKLKHSTPSSNKNGVALSSEKKTIIERYMSAFVKSDFVTIGTLLADDAVNEIVGSGIDIGKQRIRSNSMGDWGSEGANQELQAQLVILWNRPTVVFTKETENGPVLWDVTSVEIEDGHIVHHKSYYFCKNLLEAAARELQLEPDLNKDLFGYQW